MLKQALKEYEELLKVKAIKENANVQSHLKWQKATNDLLLAKSLLELSTNNEVKNSINIPDNSTFFDWVIVSSYYSIFHATQSLLGTKGIKIVSRIHYSTLISFIKHFIVNKELEDELFFIYEKVENKAKELLEIFEEEKDKRGLFQYHRLSRNNLEPAKESVENANKFLDAIGKILAKNNVI